MSTALLGPLQLGALLSPPGLLGALVLAAVVIVVGRIVLRFAWRIVVIATLAVAVLWAVAMFGGLGGVLGA